MIRILWRLIFSGSLLLAACILATVALGCCLDGSLIAASSIAVLSLIVLAFAIRGPKKRRRPITPDRLEQWQHAQAHDVLKPRSQCGKYCLANLGKPISITYNGRSRIITPIRLFGKDDYRKTYVEADQDGERRTFDLDRIEI